MILIKNGDVFQPAAFGQGDILLGGKEILAIEKNINPSGLPGEVEVIDAAGHLVVPGLIDGHQHLTGGGGEAGFPSRAPEMQLSMNTLNGVTTAVGLLGTDALTRSVKNLYAKTCALEQEGMSTRMLTGSYWLPSPTVMGNVQDDLVYLDKVIGVKLALADIRGPHVDLKMLSTLASQVRVSALVSGKPGIITVHVGIKPERLDLVAGVIDQYGVRADTFVLTHVNRDDPALLDQIFALAEQGAFIDGTGMNQAERPGSNSITAAKLAKMALERGLFGQVSISSDAGGSLPQWDKEHKNIVGMVIADPGSLLIELRRMVQEQGIPLDKALEPLTSNPARTYGMQGSKGVIQKGADGDLLVLEPGSFRPRDVAAKGQIMVRNFEVVKKGYFE